MDGKVVMVLCDGLGDEPARDRMGFLEHLVEERAATRYTSRAVIPTNSRPNYESLHTGLAPLDHGKTSNFDPGPSSHPNILSLATAAGMTTAVVGYYWFSELYHSSPFDFIDHAEYDHGEGAITFGRFYRDDGQPDSEIVVRGVMLARRYQPNYLLVHPMGIDHAGHEHGGSSTEYSQAVSNVDQMLAIAVPNWIRLGYSVLVTSDHGHDAHRYHGGTEAAVRNVPLYAIAADGRGRGEQGEVLSQLQVAPTICTALGLEIPETMQAKPFEW
jgi:predicted AlkP superfamily pyrophosphatase or phosphodiesterase